MIGINVLVFILLVIWMVFGCYGITRACIAHYRGRSGVPVFIVSLVYVIAFASGALIAYEDLVTWFSKN